MPKYYMASQPNPHHQPAEMKLCYGVMMVIHDRNVWRPVKTQLHIMDALLKLYPEITNFECHAMLARPRMGTDAICDAAQKGESLMPILEAWEQGAKRFEEQRKPYLLY